MLKIAKWFIGWRVIITFIIFISPNFLALQSDFLGGGERTYLQNPQIWSLVNFDGEHYLALAREGYKPLTHFYFPLYPILINKMNIFGNSLQGFAYTGLLLSHIFFFVTLVYLIKLLKIDFKNNFVYLVLGLLLIFPTSFYFASFYTESLFLMLVVLSFYNARKGNWFLASLFTGLSTATRIVGLALIPALLIEFWLANKQSINKSLNNRDILYLLLAPSGLLLYTFYLKEQTGDPLVFLNTVEIFGDQRSSTFVLLPQVFYRYIFKIMPHLNFYRPVVFTTSFELLSALFLTFASIVGIYKLRASYYIYMLIGFIMPTLSGSFSSLPRYSVVLFPMFIILADLLRSSKILVKRAVFALLLISLFISLSLFARGYWVS